MSEKFSRVSVRRLQGVKLLAQGYTHRQVAQQLNVSERTVCRWSTSPSVRQAIVAELAPEESPHEKYLKALNQSLPASLGVALAAMRNPDTRTSDRLKAATIIESWHRAEMERSTNYISASDAKKLIANLLEAIFRHVPDKATRAAIARDFNFLSSEFQSSNR